MKLIEIVNRIESHFPLSLAYSWDNCGLSVGDIKKDVKRVLIALDVNQYVLDEAIKSNADLIISHHPLLFNGTKRITEDNPEGRLISGLIKNNIAVYSAHTNCDIGEGGINDRLCSLFGITDAEPLEADGLGRIGFLPTPITYRDFVSLVKEKLSVPVLRCSGNLDKTIEKIAIGSGACSDSIPTAIEKGAQAMLTADLKYHEMMNYTEAGISIIDAGHYPTEKLVIDIFSEILSDCGLEIIKSQNKDIFTFV